MRDRLAFVQPWGRIRLFVTMGGVSPVIHSFRNLLVLTFIGSVALPPLALLGSTATHVSTSEIHRIALYTLLGLVALPGFYFLLIKLEPYLLEESLYQAAYLDTIT